jgi:hypothetical protein
MGAPRLSPSVWLLWCNICTGRLLPWRSNFFSKLDAAKGAEEPVPKEIDYRKITVSMAVVDEMELPLSPEPPKSAKPRSCDVILIIDIIMTAE